MTSSVTLTGKIVLPTVDTCDYRRPIPGSDDQADCTLLGQITGITNADECRVVRAACRACCESFPPSVDRWNPVTASLLFEVTSRVVEAGGVPGCTIERAVELQRRASDAINVESNSHSTLAPLRDGGRCCYLGNPVNATTMPSDGQSFQCHHPAHAITTSSQCQLCRDWANVFPVSRPLSLQEMVPIPAARTGQTIHRWSIGVVTAPRREATLAWCLDGIRRAGFDSPHVFVDGRVRIPERFSDLAITWRENPVGAWPHYWLSLAELVQRDPGADVYLLLQDDAVLFDRGNLREYLESALWPGSTPGLVSLYCSQAYTIWEPGWHARHEPWVWGALAFVFPRQLVRQFISDPDIISHRWSGAFDGRSQVDVLIGEWAAKSGYPVSFPCPSLVQHVGNTSSIWERASNLGHRRADWFAGNVEVPFARDSTLSDFPEGLFPVRRESLASYRERVDIGRIRMSQSRTVICGLCRNVRHFLPRFAARAERLGAMFSDYRVVLFENDSNDATLEFLRDWQGKNERVHILSERLGTIRYPQIRSGERGTRMAEYRNRYRDFAVEHFSDFDCAIVIDTDLPGGWSYDGLANTFGFEDWDFVGSNGLIHEHGDDFSDWRQFDAWAFRSVDHPEPHSTFEVSSMVFERGDAPLRVFGCFGGLGVYRMDAFRTCRYRGTDCEHVELHNQMRLAGFNRLYLNPSQIALYSPE